MRVSDNEAAQRVADNDNLVGELVMQLKTCRNWLNGDKWRFSKSAHERECWERRVNEIDALIAKAERQ